MSAGASAWRPPHAYVPGETARHPETLFDALKADAQVAWLTGLAFLRDGFYWEAHEVLEAVWMGLPPNSAEKLLVQAVIQIANARLKRRMGRDAAAARLIARADELAAEAFGRVPPPLMGLGPVEIEMLKTVGDKAEP